jgi:hypothetical protein
MIRVFRAGLKEFGLLLDTYNIRSTTAEAQSGDWLKCHTLCVRASMLAGTRMLPGKDADK